MIRFEYSVYNSSIPSSFSRIGGSLSPLLKWSGAPRIHRHYSSQEYFVLVILSPIGDGATGIVHEARLELTTKDGDRVVEDVVVKFAFTHKQREKMRHEYVIYHHLATNGISGIIPDVIGLFEDTEGGPMAIVMSHGGTPFADRVSDPPIATATERSVDVMSGLLS